MFHSYLKTIWLLFVLIYPAYSAIAQSKKYVSDFENFFKIKYLNNAQMINVLKQKTEDYYSKLSKCTPGEYRYGYYTSTTVSLHTSVITEMQNDLCHVKTHYNSLLDPSIFIFTQCNFKDNYLKAIANPQLSQELFIQSILLQDQQCVSKIENTLTTPST